jgi:hypothetical protein
MIEKIKQITKPYFEIRLGLWIFRGFTFCNGDTEFLFLQTLDVFGGRTNWAEINQRWKLYKINEDAQLKPMTENSIETDAGFMKRNDNADSISRRNGLTAEDITELEDYAKKESLQKDRLKVDVIAEIQPLLSEHVLVIEEAVMRLSTLTISELVKTMNQIHGLSAKIKAMYPRSYEKLQEYILKVREAYAKKKYPELYAELKKMHEDEQYKENEDDTTMGFGPRFMHGSLFYQYFMKSSTHDMWELRSPIEDRFQHSILFKELVLV